MVNSNVEIPDGPPPHHPPEPPHHHPTGPHPQHPHHPTHPPGPPPNNNDAFIHVETSSKKTPTNAIYSIQIKTNIHINNEASAIVIPAMFGARMEVKETQLTAKSIYHNAYSPIPQINDYSKDYFAIIPRGGCPFDVKAKYLFGCRLFSYCYL